MFMSAKTFFDDNTNKNMGTLRRMETEMPADFVRIYRKNVARTTPHVSGALKSSIITQVLGNTGTVGWRLPYAAAQNEGGHDQKQPVQGWNHRDNDGYKTIKPGFYRYKRGNKGFATRAFYQTQKDMEPLLRARGYIK